MLRKTVLLLALTIFASQAFASRKDERCRDAVKTALDIMHDGYAHIWCLKLSKKKDDVYKMYAEYMASGKLVQAKVKFDSETCDIKGYEPLLDDEKVKRKDWRKLCDEGPLED